jgi:hypothetical protein
MREEGLLDGAHVIRASDRKENPPDVVRHYKNRGAGLSLLERMDIRCNKAIFRIEVEAFV